jgi:uncharacterized coiled-coil protein SlyX
MESLKSVAPWVVPIITAVVTWWLYRRKYEAEVNNVFVNSAGKIIGMYQDTFDQFKDRVAELEKKSRKQQEEIATLQNELKIQTSSFEESKRRVRLLAKVIVCILEGVSTGDERLCVDDFINGINVSADDHNFLTQIIEEVDSESNI